MAEDVTSPAPETDPEHKAATSVLPEAPAEAVATETAPVSPPEPAVAPVAEALHHEAPATLPEAVVQEEPPAPEANEEEEEEAEPAAVAEAEPVPENKKHWYVVKVQSGREDTIKEAIERRVRKEGLEEYFGQIVIPVEKITEVKQDKNGKRVTRTKERKLYPGYLMVEVEYNDRILYLFRETSGVGDFVGSHPHNLERAPTPMSEREVQRMVGPKGIDTAAPVVPTVPKGLDVGHRVRVVDGTFNGMEGVVKQILEAVGKVQVEVSIFGRPVPVELDYYQVEEA